MRSVKYFSKKLSSVKVLSKEVGQRVSALIKAKPRGFQSELAKKLGLNEGTVSKWAAGRPPKLDHLRLAATLLGESFEFLLTGTATAKDRAVRHDEEERRALAAEVERLRKEISRLHALAAQFGPAPVSSRPSKRQP